MLEDKSIGIVPGLCSVMVPVYNGERWLEQCLSTLVAQTYRAIEIITVDDGSTDRTPAILAKFAAADSRFRIITHETNCGEWAARNTALKAARGEFLARQDADDWCVPTRLERQIKRLGERPTADIVTCGTVWSGDGRNGLDLGGPRGLIPEVYMAGGPATYPHHPTIVCRREVYDHVGCFEPIAPFGCDSVWGIRSVMRGMRWTHLPGAFYFYRRHKDSMMRSGDTPAGIRAVTAIRKVEQEKWDWPYFIHRNLDVLTNGSCNLNCPACNQVPFRRDFADYQASMADIEKVCRRVIELGMNYDTIGFSGGEPLLWENLEDACRLAKNSGAFRRVRLFTNCYDRDRLIRAMDDGLVDTIYTSICNVVPQNLGPVMARHRDKVHLGFLPRHVWAPNKPIAGSLPAKCTCDRNTVLGNMVYPCGAFYSQHKRLGHRLEDYAHLTTTLDDDWKVFFRGFDMYQMDLCRYCPNNEKVFFHLRTCPEPHWPGGMPIPQAPLSPPMMPPTMGRQGLRFRNQARKKPGRFQKQIARMR